MPSTRPKPGASAKLAYPTAAQEPAVASSAGTPRRRMRVPTKAVTSTEPAVASNRIRPRSPTGAPNVTRIDGHAVPRMPSGSPRTTKLPRASTSDR